MKVEIPKSTINNVIYSNELTDEHLIIAYIDETPLAILIQDPNDYAYYFMKATGCDYSLTSACSTIQECIYDLMNNYPNVRIEAYLNNE